MAVHYSHRVATDKFGQGFFWLLFLWKGSVYRAVSGDLAVYLVFYFSLSFTYRFGLTEPYKTIFENVCLLCQASINFMPLTFVLGFYLVRVITRRWNMWENIPWPDRLGYDVSAFVDGSDVKSRIVRRTLVRYANLGSILCYRDICVPVKKRFPTLDHLVSAGLLTFEELNIFLTLSSRRTSNWWIPFHWGFTLVRRMLKEGKISENEMLRLHESIAEMRLKCNVLFIHDWLPVPLIYTQVATLSVYLFMAVSLMGAQYLDTEKHYPNHNVDLYVPFFTIFTILFYLGWLKVAEVIINPLGEDDEDFDMNYIVDRNLKVAYAMVDEACLKVPPVERDLHWGLVEPAFPHTAASHGLKNMPFIGSASNIKLNQNQVQSVNNDSSSTLDDDRSIEPLIEGHDSSNQSGVTTSAKKTTDAPPFGKMFSLRRTSTAVHPAEKQHKQQQQTAAPPDGFKKTSLYRKNNEPPHIPRKCISQNTLTNISESNDDLLESVLSDKSNR